MSNFRENVLEVLKEREISIKNFCKQVGIGKNSIYNLKNHSPNLETALKIANNLKLSLAFLTERSDNGEEFTPKHNEINFYNNLEKLLEKSTTTKAKFYKELKFSTDLLTRWKNGAVPYLSNIILIADYFNVEIEELLGRK